MNCHSNEKLEELARENKRVKLTLKNGQFFEGRLKIPFTGCGYVLECKEFDLRFVKSHVKKIEEV